jgi:hypothetical protein
MLRTILSAVAILACSATFALADPKDDISAALQKLTDAGSYTWNTTTDAQGGFGSGTQVGKTANGVTSVTINSSFGDNQVTLEFILKDGQVAIKNDDGWHTPQELADADGGGGPGRFAGRMAQNFKAPAAQALAQIDNLTNIQVADGVYSADFTEEGAKQLLTLGRRRPAADGQGPQVSNAKASVKMWIADGALTKTEMHVAGTVSFNGNDRDIDRTTTTEFSAVGSTTVDIPPEAAAKLAPTTQPAPAPQQ